MSFIFDQADLYRFEVRLELYGANARLAVSPPPASSLVLFLSLSFSSPDAPAKSMASSHDFTPPRQVLARLAPLV